MKFEYMTVVFGYTEAIAATGSKPWRVNDVELKNWKKGLDRIAYINNLGAEGWELVAIDPSSGREFYFKRKISD